MALPLVLLVDDAPDVGVILRRYARASGHALAVEPDAESAWRFLQQGQRPDLLLLDLNLPGVSGLELCRRLRATPVLVDLPIALFSHFDRPQDIAAGLEAGADHVLSKDLLLDPGRWQCRLAEILQPPAGRFPPSLLVMMEPRPITPRRLAEQLNQALRGPVAWQLGAGVTQALVRRAWQRACRVPPDGTGPETQDPNHWLAADGQGIDVERFAQAADPVVLPAFVRVLAEQSWRLLGTEACAAFWQPLPAPAGADPAPMHESHAILLVEDNPADIQITRRALRDSNIPVDLIVVRDGQEAVDYLLRQGSHAVSPSWRKPDLILLDLNLPRLTGREVLQRVRATELLRLVPVVVLSTSNRQEDVEALYATGANTYIEKPQDFSRFVEVLQTIQRYWLDHALLPPVH